MAYASLVSLGQTIDQILNHSLYSLYVDDKQHIVAIHEYVIFLQAFLEYFPEKAKNLEGRFRELANEAEDVVEYIMSEQIRSSDDVECEYYPSDKYEHQLKRVAEEMDSIAGQVMEIKNSFRVEDVRFGEDSSAASSSSRVTPTSKDVMVGFDEDLLAIKTRLCGEPSKLQVLPIVGMGGIGKTTLARNAYDDPFVVEYFDIRAWVTISQDYSAKEILSGLRASIKVDESSGQGNDDEKVYKSLKGRRYIIILDDMWDIEAWDIVRKIFPNDNNGSRIMLTTRLSYVAAYPGSCSYSHEMLFMDVNQSWNLLRQRVFVGQDCPRELEDIGKMIARNCKGLPLAIVVVAGLLSVVNKTRISWEEIAEKVNAAVSADHGQIDEILSLSYAHLPHHLRPCFLYLGVFGEDSEVHVSKLVRLWVAEGFLRRQNQSKSLEEEAEEYLEDLVKRNLVLVTKRRSSGKIKSCRLHDLIRDLCIRKSKEEKFLVHLAGEDVEKGDCAESSTKHHRRITITSDDLPRLSSIDSSSIHTIFMNLKGSHVKLDFLTSARLLRVLDAGNSEVWSLPVQLFEQLHLRFLAIDSVLWRLPLALSNFQNLQTLIINDNDRKMSFDVYNNHLLQEIWMMKQLRHLLLRGRLPNPKGTTSALDNLQTLSLVSHYICCEETVRMIPNVKKLRIYCSDYQDVALLQNLVHLHQLENLSLYPQGTLHFGKIDFAFPKTLKKLRLDDECIPWDNLTVVGSLPNLQALKLREGFNDKGTRTWKTTEGEFQKLEFLRICSSTLNEWISESNHFPRLKSLQLYHCHSLSHIPDDLGEIPTLELIEITECCREDLVRSAKHIQEEQEDLGNYALQVRCIPR